MFKNYFKITYRNIVRQKTYSAINIAGLAVGMSCFILISLWVQDELSFDRFHENSDHIYRIVDYEKYSNGEEVHFSQNAAPLGPILKEKYPEILQFTRYRRGEHIVSYGNKKFNQPGFDFTDPSFFELFSFPLIKGNRETVLSDPFSIVITEEMANKYFGNEEPIGKTLRVDNRLDFIVSGVVGSVPGNSHIQFNMLVPFQTISEFGYNIDNWRSWAYATYVLLDKNADYREVSRKISNVIIEHESDALATISLQPLRDVHLYSKNIWGFGGDGEIKYVFIFSVIAILILLTACINFMNLATARSSKRTKEVGLCKVVGANRKEIIVQFLNESVILSFIALFFSLSFVNIALPYFNELAGKELAFSLTGNISIIVLVISTVITTGIISGSYPALFLSAFQPVKVLKGTLSSGAKGANFRRILVSFQFVLTILLIFGTLVINRQLNFIKDQKLGYNDEQVISVELPGELGKKSDYIKNEILKNTDVVEVSAASGQPNRIGMSRIFREWEGRQGEEQFLAFMLISDESYKETFQLEMAAGRYFSKMITTDTGTVVINEAAMSVMGMDEPIGKSLGPYKIIGVLKDFHFRPLRTKIGPLIVFYGSEDFSYDQLMVKLHPQKIASFSKTWATVVPDFPLEYKFVNEQTERMYRTEMRVEKVMNTFTVLILFIACLGLFGLASFVAEQRTKEIGIRKVLGASIPGILVLLNTEFIKWIIIAVLIAWPVGWFVMDSWLQTFAYKIDMTLWMFLVSGVAILVIALLTVSSQAIKASLKNPVDSLRYE